MEENNQENHNYGEKMDIDKHLSKGSKYLLIGIILITCSVIYFLMGYWMGYLHKSTIAKPIVYLYPEEETLVEVKVGYPENLTCSYPKYENAWNVLAKPNGDLKDLETGRNLYSLYYEANNKKEYKLEKDGFIIKGEDTAKFLEEKLEILGLNEKEAEEFIIYWLPKLEANRYNYIRFALDEEIENNMPLTITPNPDTLIRVVMTYKGLDKPINVEEQVLEKVERTGFAVVEWGGSEIEE